MVEKRYNEKSLPNYHHFFMKIFPTHIKQLLTIFQNHLLKDTWQ